MDGASHVELGLAPNQLTLRPSGSDVYGGEREEEEALAGIPAMGHQVDLQEAWPADIPIAEGPDRDAALQEAARRSRGKGPAAVLLPQGPQEPLDGAGAHGPKFLLDVGAQSLVPMALHHLHQLRQEGLQPLGADAVSDFPQVPQHQRQLGTIAAAPS